MPDQDTITAIQQRLAAARQRLATLLQQQALHGPGYVSPGVLADIAEARNTISYCKSVLHRMTDPANTDEIARQPERLAAERASQADPLAY